MGTGLAIAAVVVGVIGVAMAAYGMYEQGEQQKEAFKSQAEMSEYNATLARQAGEARARDLRERNRRILATARANAGASGIALTAGTSPLAVLAYDAKEGELDALRAQYGGEVEATGLNAQARMQRFSGANASYAANIGAGSTLLSGLGSAGVNYGLSRAGGGAGASASRSYAPYAGHP